MATDLGPDTRVEPATQADIDWVEAHYREGDRRGHEALGGGRTTLGMFESCWAIRHRGALIGYCGVALPTGETWFGAKRWLCYMSATTADKVKLAYVKMSRRVMAAVVAETPPHVTTFLSAPLADYAGSVRWHERVLKMRRAGEAVYKGVRFALFATTRKEVTEW